MRPSRKGGLACLLRACRYLLSIPIWVGAAPAFAQCVLSGAPDYKGLRMLSPIAAFEKRFPEFQCEARQPASPLQQCTADDTTFGSVQANVVASFFDGKLFQLRVDVAKEHRERIVRGLEAKHGKAITDRERCGRGKVDKDNDKEWSFSADYLLETYETADNISYVVEMTALVIVNTPAFKRRQQEIRKRQRKDM